jgi:cysteinyl-tRNA synthetase
LPVIEADEAVLTPYRERFQQAMDDDFNTPEAFAILFELARDINRAREESEHTAAGLAAVLRKLGDVLGVLQQDPEIFLRGDTGAGLSDAEIDELIVRRNQARADKDWAEADRFRDTMQEHNIVLEDGAAGTSWRRE